MTIELAERFRKLKEMMETRSDRARAGYEFEILLEDILRAAQLDVVPPQKREVDQIDGAFRLDSHWYLYEAKWRVGRADVQMIDHFAASIRRSSGGTSTGFFFSYGGFTAPAIAAAKAQRPISVVLCDGAELEAAISERTLLVEILRAKIQMANITGEVYHKLVGRVRDGHQPTMILAAIGRPIVLGCALGSVVIYDRSLDLANLSTLKDLIVVAAFDEEDLDAQGKYETWRFEHLLPTPRGAIANIGGGLDHFSTRVREWCFRTSGSKASPVIGGLFGDLRRDRPRDGVVIGGRLIRNGAVIAIDGASVYVPSDQADGDFGRKRLTEEADRHHFFDADKTGQPS